MTTYLLIPSAAVMALTLDSAFPSPTLLRSPLPTVLLPDRYCRPGRTFSNATLTWLNVSPGKETNWLGSSDAAAAVDPAEEGKDSNTNQRHANKEDDATRS